MRRLMNIRGRNTKKVRTVMQSEGDLALEEGGKKQRRAKKPSKRVLLGLVCLLIAAGVTFGLGMWSSRYPDALNMGTACKMENMPQMNMSLCQTKNGTATNIPIASLQAPQTAASVDDFTL